MQQQTLAEQVRQLKEIVAREAQSPSLTHDLGHLQRTARGARWIVRMVGGSQEEQMLAYAAGWLHDLERPFDHDVDHAQKSADKSKHILNKLDFSQDQIEKICRAVRDHSEKEEWNSPLHGSVYGADKLLEGMGAYIIFRRGVWIGESPDYANKTPLAANIAHFENRMEQHGKDNFPHKLKEVVDYQFKWQQDFLQALREEEDYALEIMNYCYQAGQKANTENGTRFAEVIINFTTNHEQGKKLKDEAENYLAGGLFKKLARLVKA